jgi:TPR repeat protein
MKWYRLAAEQGYAFAQYDLGVMYDKGEGVLKDYPQAVKWYRLAAEQDYVEAQIHLGVMYANGQGVSKDYVLAYMWSDLGAVAGDDTARKNRSDLATKMTPAQIAEAQKLSREWKPTPRK